MNKRILVASLIITFVGIAGFIATQAGPNSTASSEKNGTSITIYKSPTCGCCGIYASYMKKEGYSVESKNVQNMSTIKNKFGVPYELESCHTTEVGGYVVEGHVPEEVVQKLLAENPDIKGVGMPGMPSGSPGMPGPKTEEFAIYEITHEGSKGDIFMTI